MDEEESINDIRGWVNVYSPMWVYSGNEKSRGIHIGRGTKHKGTITCYEFIRIEWTPDFHMYVQKSKEYLLEEHKRVLSRITFDKSFDEVINILKDSGYIDMNRPNRPLDIWQDVSAGIQTEEYIENKRI